MVMLLKTISKEDKETIKISSDLPARKPAKARQAFEPHKVSQNVLPHEDKLTLQFKEMHNFENCVQGHGQWVPFLPIPMLSIPCSRTRSKVEL